MSQNIMKMIVGNKWQNIGKKLFHFVSKKPNKSRKKTITQVNANAINKTHGVLQLSSCKKPFMEN